MSPLKLSCLALLLSCLTMEIQAQIKVELISNSDEYQLLRHEKPYLIKGVGGHDSLDELVKAGGNSIRTWSSENLGEILDQAQTHGLTVCAGFWLGHERHGFDYQNAVAVQKQLESCLEVVRKHRDHPALLMWAIGNEMEGDGTNPAIWYAVNHIARECKRIDPHHPTMTVIAELGENEIKLHNLKRFCPDIDIVGVNSYAGITSLAKRYRKVGIQKPYVVTEHGPHGPWEVQITAWGAPFEPTSTEKGEQYQNGYRSTAVQDSGSCLGSYAFLWGHKQETTATWFGMLLPDGRKLAAVDAMSELWTGSPPENLAPRIQKILLSRSQNLKPGEKVTAEVEAVDPEGQRVSVEWVLRYDSVVIGEGGDAQSEELTFREAVKSSGHTASVTVPKGGGGYRLYAYVSDEAKKVAVANVPFFVDAPRLAVPAPKARLPFTLYDEGDPQDAYTPSGYMGNTDSIAMELQSEERPKFGEKCLKVTYANSGEWGGVLWQSPPQDWDGKQPGGYDFGKAVALEFWAKGAQGGEIVNFQIGGIGGEHLYRDSATVNLKEVRLTTQWQKYRIPLNGQDLSRIKTGFGWSLAGQGRPISFYLDRIQYLSE